MKKLCTTIFVPAAVLLVSSTVYGDKLKCDARLSGAQEVTTTSVDTPAKGKIEVKFDKGFTKAEVELEFEDTLGTANRAHFHCAFAGANGPVAFGIVDPGPADCDPADLAAGNIECTLTNADFNNADCLANIGRPVSNIAALAFAMRRGSIYVNVHTTAFPGGEIRGQLLCDDDDDDKDGNKRKHRDDD